MEGNELARAARAGSREAFATLIRMNEAQLYAIARGILSSRTDVMDAVQEAILLAYREVVKLREPAYFRTWLVRILINECRRVARHNRKIIPVDRFHEGKNGSHELESDLELMDLLNELDLEHKEIVVLFYLEDLSVKEIASIVDLSESGVKSRLHRARLKLAMLMKDPVLKEELP
ncbi:sigma-70 family RNA polymerase sigma factor [Paenibacillaceae bacterium WGS1546]|uniref:sigma-70 family RNA polymerase sigma factor n=1 Tax=Cohnella sp. WGS1546 TaxID=3366810 RepID=UPI00372D6D81